MPGGESEAEQVARNMCRPLPRLGTRHIHLFISPIYRHMYLFIYPFVLICTKVPLLKEFEIHCSSLNFQYYINKLLYPCQKCILFVSDYKVKDTEINLNCLLRTNKLNPAHVVAVKFIEQLSQQCEFLGVVEKWVRGKGKNQVAWILPSPHCRCHHQPQQPGGPEQALRARDGWRLWDRVGREGSDTTLPHQGMAHRTAL